LEKWKKGRGYGQNNHLLPPSLTIQGRRRQGGRPVEGRGVQATQATGAAGKWGKTKRRSRATHSAPHLGRGRTVEGDRQRRAVCNPERHGRHWWWRWRARDEGELVVEVRDEVGSRSGPFIGAGRSVRWRYLSSRSFDGHQWRWGKISWH
jgi:hypothetical protein